MPFRKGISRMLGKGKKQDRDQSFSNIQRGSLEHGTRPFDTPSGSQHESQSAINSKVDVSSDRNASIEHGTQPIETPSRGQRAREAGIILLKFVSAVSGATDLLKPVNVVSECIRQVLELAKSVDMADEDWVDLIQRLKHDKIIIESQTGSLEEDERLDESPPPRNSDIEKPLEAYIKILNTVYQQLDAVYQKRQRSKGDGLSRMRKALDLDYNKGVIKEKTRDLDSAFQRYTVALEHLVSKRVDQIQEEVAQLLVEVKQQGQEARLDRLKGSNVYGNQHHQCLQGTRVKTLAAIHQWANDENTTSPLFCLLDVAGSGKSTVAKHLVNEWKREGWLIGRFFFSRDTTETMSTRLFCSTVCDAFASVDQGFKAHSSQFKAQPDWERLSFEEQYEGLVAAPLRALGRRAILTIDALDECEDRIKLLEVLRDRQSSIPLFRAFVTGRPEADIKRWSEKSDRIRITNFQMLEGYNQDVEKYIRFRLEDMSDIQDRVINRAEGLFIWARIACDLLVEAADIHGLLEQLEGPVEGDAKLDAIYRVALEQATPRDQPSQRAMVKVLQMILAARSPLSIAELEKVSPWNEGNVVERIVTRLGSLLLYQGRQDPIRLLHTTLREFLTARQRARIYYIQLESGHYTLASGSLNYLSDPRNQGVGTPGQRKAILFEELSINC